jgi:hypothetical protein
MSRSIREPYLLPALGVASQRRDRQRANRAYRRAAAVALQTVEHDALLLPLQRDSRLGDRANWSGDGKPRRFVPRRSELAQADVGELMHACKRAMRK